jgi:hypothetical protein
MKTLDWSVEKLGREYTTRELSIKNYTNQSSEQEMSCGYLFSGMETKVAVF